MESGQLPQKTFMPEALGAVYYVADFADLNSVRTLATQLKKAYPKIDVLINNAGGLFGERALTVDGHERTFQVNHLAPFLLTNELSANRAYGNSKLANILFTRELHRRFHAKGLSAVAVHPGVIATNLANDTTSFLGFLYRTPLAKLLLDTPEKGAEPLVWLATSMPGTDWESGAY